ncbi:MAG: carboxypeptidase-like regulatory domain-containing protein [Oscillospiraceae bacterium]|jgi:hypothetical protein|nr:carboxypeptidase-like regulatory domain-containing protein [Oscillospiraceae bacterium]
MSININSQIQAIQSAVYGEEVRGAIASALEAIQYEINNNSGSGGGVSPPVTDGRTIVVNVKDESGVDMQGVEVLLLNAQFGTTNSAGLATFEQVADGNYNLVIAKEGYQSMIVEITVDEGHTEFNVILLEVVPDTGERQVEINIVGSNSNPISNVTIAISGLYGITDSSGQAIFELSDGEHTVTASSDGYQVAIQTINVSAGNTSFLIVLQEVTYSVQIETKVQDLYEDIYPVRANVTLSGVTQMTNTQGKTTFNGLPNGTYTVTVVFSDGYYADDGMQSNTATDTVTVNGSNTGIVFTGWAF